MQKRRLRSVSLLLLIPVEFGDRADFAESESQLPLQRNCLLGLDESQPTTDRTTQWRPVIRLIGAA